MAQPHLALVAPATVKRTVMPKRAKNSDLRTREYLTEQEIETLVGAARQNRYGHRDATMILVAFRHGLRASEVVDLRWDQVDFNQAALHVRRVKQGTLAASLWPTRATTPARCKPTSVTEISSTRCVIPSCHRRGSRTSGGDMRQGNVRFRG